MPGPNHGGPNPISKWGKKSPTVGASGDGRRQTCWYSRHRVPQGARLRDNRPTMRKQRSGRTTRIRLGTHKDAPFVKLLLQQHVACQWGAPAGVCGHRWLLTTTACSECTQDLPSLISLEEPLERPVAPPFSHFPLLIPLLSASIGQIGLD